MIGLKYTSAWVNPSGYGDAARNFITALFTVGVNVSLETVSQMTEQTTYGMTGSICQQLENRDIPYKIKIIHLTPDLYPMYREEGKYNIGHLFWETSKLPKEWITPCNEMDEIWVASAQMADMLIASGVRVPVFGFPQPIDVTKAEEKIIAYKNPKDFVFYAIFQWITRKNPKVLLHAYWKEFEGNDNVTLLLKSYRITYLPHEFALIKAEIESWKRELKLSHYPKIYLVEQLLTEHEMLRLHTMGDVFVNPSSGEGWNRPMQEAMLLCKPVVSGDNGGITDILTPQYYYKVATRKVAATEQPFIPWYTHDMQWKEVEENDLKRVLRKVYEEYGETKGMSQIVQKFIVDNFSFQTVGIRMAIRLLKIQQLL